MATGAKERILITVDSEDPQAVARIKNELMSAGLQDARVVSPQIIAGSVAPGRRQNLVAVRGVIAVEADEEMRAL